MVDGRVYPCKPPFRTLMRILIAGRSLAGLATAAFLQAGVPKFDLRVFESQAGAFTAELRQGAGIALHDDSVSCLTSGGVTSEKAFQSKLQPMRLIEERITDGRVMVHRPHSFHAAIWFDVYSLLADAAKDTTSVYGKKLCRYEQTAEGVTAFFDDGSKETGDLLIGADGVHSAVRKQMHPASKTAYRGYSAWRGVCPTQKLEANGLLSRLRARYQDLGNCLCIEMGPPGHSSVFYELGSGHVNWLLYAEQTAPIAGEKKVTRPAGPEELEQLQTFLRANWHGDFADLLQATDGIFVNDIYDMDPLSSFSDGRVVLVGDAAHPSTPHAAMGSNMAICDAFALAGQIVEACARSDAAKPTLPTVRHHIRQYEKTRVPATAHTLLLSRHLGRLRNGAITTLSSVTVEQYEKLLPLPGPTVAAAIPTVALNHVSRETNDVARLSAWYQTVLGFEPIQRPAFPFGGAWLRLAPNIALHIIEADPDAGPLQTTPRVEPRFIRRGPHLAFTVVDVDVVLGLLQAHGVDHHVNTVPGTSSRQVFFYDPDGNGIEVGDFPMAIAPFCE